MSQKSYLCTPCVFPYLDSITRWDVEELGEIFGISFDLSFSSPRVIFYAWCYQVDRKLIQEKQKKLTGS